MTTQLPRSKLRSYGLAWSSDATVVFYVRFDDAQRPHQLWRHQLGTDPAQDILVLEEAMIGPDDLQFGIAALQHVPRPRRDAW